MGIELKYIIIVLSIIVVTAGIMYGMSGRQQVQIPAGDLKIVMYSKQTCPYCILAQQLLKDENLKFKVIEIAESAQLRQEMINLSGGRTTVPQIFFNDKHIGGYSDLKELKDSGLLRSKY